MSNVSIIVNNELERVWKEAGVAWRYWENHEECPLELLVSRPRLEPDTSRIQVSQLASCSVSSLALAWNRTLISQLSSRQSSLYIAIAVPAAPICREIRYKSDHSMQSAILSPLPQFEMRLSRYSFPNTTFPLSNSWRICYKKSETYFLMTTGALQKQPQIFKKPVFNLHKEEICYEYEAISSDIAAVILLSCNMWIIKWNIGYTKCILCRIITLSSVKLARYVYTWHIK
jgi:hypothetical protein